MTNMQGPSVGDKSALTSTTVIGGALLGLGIFLDALPSWDYGSKATMVEAMYAASAVLLPFGARKILGKIASGSAR